MAISSYLQRRKFEGLSAQKYREKQWWAGALVAGARVPDVHAVEHLPRYSLRLLQVTGAAGSGVRCVCVCVCVCVHAARAREPGG